MEYGSLELLFTGHPGPHGRLLGAPTPIKPLHDGQATTCPGPAPASACSAYKFAASKKKPQGRDAHSSFAKHRHANEFAPRAGT